MTKTDDAKQTNPLLEKENRWRWFGRHIITPAYAIGSSTITTVAVAGVSFIAGLPLLFLIPFLSAVFIAEAIINIYLYKDAVPKTLIDLFVKKFFQDSAGKDLSAAQKTWIGIGFFAALSGGIAVGALAFLSIGKAVGVILGLAGAACPPLGIALGVMLGIVACIAFTSLLTKWIKSAVEEKIHLQVGQFFKNLLTRTDKPLVQEILEKVFKTLFAIGIFAITIVGTIATLGTIEKGLNRALLLIPTANKLATKIASSIMTFVLLGIARLPFVLTHVCKFFARIGEHVGQGIYKLGSAIGQKCFGYKPATPKPETNTIPVETNSIETNSRFKTTAKIGALLVFSFSHGALAQSEGGKVISQILDGMNTSLSPDALTTAGQDSSLISGALMASGIGGYALFPDKEHSAAEEAVKIQNNLNR